ncbi:MAG: hypothetical protein KFF49_12410, partial [Bacteroidales bacterium]|nr:hypothetical protein [Bacteroidales bacterium]
MYKLTILLAAFTLLLNSCLPPCEEYIEGSLPSSPVNLEAFNSEYDDYNASAPVLGAFIPFCFSTNRNSEGGDFDIIYEPMTIDWDMQTGDINIYNDFGDWLGAMQEYSVLNNALQLINTDGNQLGPNIILNSGSYFSEYDFLFMYASDEGGDYQIGFTYNLDSPYFSECQEIDFLNSPYDDLYPSFNMDYNQVYFCSDRDNDVFNIYSVD